MTFEEIRVELMAQHDEIRDLIELIRSSDTQSRGTHLTLLRDILTAHNAREEELLGDVLPDIDAWGEIRAVHMTEDHEAEHRSMLNYVTELEGMDGLSDVEQLAERLLAHLEDEEKTYLNAKVLRDDIIAIGHTGG